MKYFVSSFFIFQLLSLPGASAKTISMVQGGKTFLGEVTDKQASDAYDDPSIEETHKVDVISAKVGDEIRFMNRDEVSHNVSGSKAQKVIFDVKLQEPGKAHDRSVKLSEKGEYVIQCAIHPKMKFKVKVD